MSEIGHNGGPTLEPGFGFRKHAWTRARKELMPTLPLQIVRIRVKRAERLGLDYKTYASIRARSGRDIVGFLFSGNALELRPQRIELPERVQTRLASLDGEAKRVAAIYAPQHPDAIVAANPGILDHTSPAPGFTSPWAEMRDRITATIRQAGLPADGVVLVAATDIEREWCAAGKLAGELTADRFFRSAHV